jgi:hypothetical protein
MVKRISAVAQVRRPTTRWTGVPMHRDVSQLDYPVATAPGTDSMTCVAN